MNVKEEIKEIIKKEAQALIEISQRVSDDIGKVIADICVCSGKIVVTGMGKNQV